MGSDDHALGFVAGQGFTQDDWDEVSDSPETTDEEQAQARPMTEALPELVAAMRRKRGTPKVATKDLVSLRIDKDVLETLRASGPGWQGRANEMLRKGLGKIPSKKTKQPIMSPESEQFMAFSGVQQSALAVVDRRDELRRLTAEMIAVDPQAPRRGEVSSWIIPSWRRQSVATDFCVALVLLHDFVEWAVRLGYFKGVLSPEFHALDWSKIKDVRDMRVHVNAYFEGYGWRPDRWVEQSPDASGDASGMIGTLIGNRVDYEEVGGIVEQMLETMLTEPHPRS